MSIITYTFIINLKATNVRKKGKIKKLKVKNLPPTTKTG